MRYFSHIPQILQLELEAALQLIQMQRQLLTKWMIYVSVPMEKEANEVLLVRETQSMDLSKQH